MSEGKARAQEAEHSPVRAVDELSEQQDVAPCCSNYSSQGSMDNSKVCLFVRLFVCLLVYSVALRHHYVDFELSGRT